LVHRGNITADDHSVHDEFNPTFDSGCLTR
jgi:hypothetical protein